jgi:microsomal dipeptidase-like Zn-dependent dipeptidase
LGAIKERSLDRRNFLIRVGTAGLASSIATLGYGSEQGAAENVAGPLIADPHAHPFQFFGSRSTDRTTPTLELLQDANVALCAFAAVGDMTYQRGRIGMPFSDTVRQLEQVRHLEEKGQLGLVRKATDVLTLSAHKACHGLMAIEGADALEGQLKNLDSFYAYGVRQITLLHERNNELGFNQRSREDGPLTRFGIETVERMNSLGMVVDVAHASTETLKSIAATTTQPLVDSHTSPFLPGEEGTGSRRLRTWQEMEWVAKTGGVVCTWPFAYVGKSSERTTLRHWAEEISMMKSRLGIEHCGLGTDGGGGLPRVVDGWKSIASLPRLMDAMRGVGLSQSDVAAIVGGNFLRVLSKCLV